MADWTEAEQARIQAIQEERGCTRGNALKVLQAEKKRAAVVDPLNLPRETQATPKAPAMTSDVRHPELRHTPVQTQAVAPVENSKQETAPVKTKKEKKAKAPKKPRGEKKSGKQIYVEREAAGMCVSCGSRKAMKGHKECAYDVLRTRESTKARKEKTPWNIDNFRRTKACIQALEHNTIDEK
jgi:ribosomal protein L24